MRLLVCYVLCDPFDQFLLLFPLFSLNMLAIMPSHRRLTHRITYFVIYIINIQDCCFHSILHSYFSINSVFCLMWLCAWCGCIICNVCLCVCLCSFLLEMDIFSSWVAVIFIRKCVFWPFSFFVALAFFLVPSSCPFFLHLPHPFSISPTSLGRPRAKSTHLHFCVWSVMRFTLNNCQHLPVTVNVVILFLFPFSKRDFRCWTELKD